MTVTKVNGTVENVKLLDKGAFLDVNVELPNDSRLAAPYWHYQVWIPKTDDNFRIVQEAVRDGDMPYFDFLMVGYNLMINKL